MAKRKKKLPFGIPREPRVANTKVAMVDVDDHLGKSSVMVGTWWSGEGLTIEVHGTDHVPRQSIDLTFSEFEAMKLAVRAVMEE